nr:MAG TPA: hypothetical protein [Caudoviricetes sp.]
MDILIKAKIKHSELFWKYSYRSSLGSLKK